MNLCIRKTAGCQADSGFFLCPCYLQKRGGARVFDLICEKAIYRPLPRGWEGEKEGRSRYVEGEIFMSLPVLRTEVKEKRGAVRISTGPEL
jgi:hypothetical protein